MKTRNLIGTESQSGSLAVMFGPAKGAQLLEFAIVLPLLLVLLVGIFDFGWTFNLKQKLNNAAREGARSASTMSCWDCGQSAPPSTRAVRDLVANYLTNAKVTTCAIDTTPASGGSLAWQYSSTTTGSGCANFSLLIERGHTFMNSSGVLVVSSRVTLTYPVSWSYDKIITMLVPGAPSLPKTITTDAIMQNLI